MPWTNASIVLNSRDATRGTYNNLTFNAVGQNIIQGQVDSIAVSEVNFPYDIPNVQAPFNSFSVDYIVAGGGSIFLQPVVPPGFYTGTELATAVTAAIQLAGANNMDPADAPNPIAADNLPTCVYDDVSNRFSLLPPADYNPAYPYWQIDSPWTFPDAEIIANRVVSPLGKDLFSIMGFVRNSTNQYNDEAATVDPTEPPGALLPGTFPAFAQTLVDGYDTPAIGGSAPLAFTQYIDICSPQLCQFQYFRDGSTTNLARRSDVICRLYISNNVATQEDEGVRPFVIHRQFKNARVMRWTADNSVGTLDIQLYDDTGQPLLTSWTPRPYQITFNCYELSAEEGMGR